MANLTACGCRNILVGYQGDPDTKIEFCSLHEAANELLQLVKAEFETAGIVTTQEWEQVIAKAEGNSNV